MYIISQTMIFLLLALIIGGAIGFAFRACMADTACDDVREDLALAQARLQEMETNKRNAARAVANDLGMAPFPKQTERVGAPAFVPQPIVTLADTPRQLPTAPEMGGASPTPLPTLSTLSPRELETLLLAADPGASPKSRFEADDLTVIRGLTPDMDRWLGNLGITRLADIASLTAPELFWLVENLPGDGSSVYRDHWVAQASAIMGKV